MRSSSSTQRSFASCSERPRIAEHRADQEVLENRHALERQRDLIGAADSGAATLVRREFRDVPTVELNPAGIRGETAGDEIEDGGLAGAVRAEDAQRFALLNLEGQVVCHFQRSEILRNAFEGK